MNSVRIIKTEFSDLQAILALQKQAYMLEARAVNNYEISPLAQTIENTIEDYEKGFIYKALDENNNLIGSIRGYIKDGTLYIGKVMVDPEFHNQGLGSRLIHFIESLSPNLRYELFTNPNNLNNVNFYIKNGYREFRRQRGEHDIEFVYFEKLPGKP